MTDAKEKIERAVKRPYFIWDYDLTEDDVRAILRGDNEYEKLWIMARIMESARWEDIWQYLKPDEIREYWPQLHHRLRKEVRDTWAFAMEVWYGIRA